MSGNIAVPSSSFRHYRFDVFERNLTERFEGHRIQMPQRSGCVELDPIGAVFHLAAHFGDHRVARVRERGGIRAEENTTENQTPASLFCPLFSTAEAAHHSLPSSPPRPSSVLLIRRAPCCPTRRTSAIIASRESVSAAG